MPGRGVDFTLKFATEMIKVIYALSRVRREVNMSDIVNTLKTDYHVATRYRRALEELGLIRVRPEGRENRVELTEKGLCIAKCLVD